MAVFTFLLRTSLWCMFLCVRIFCWQCPEFSCSRWTKWATDGGHDSEETGNARRRENGKLCCRQWDLPVTITYVFIYESSFSSPSGLQSIRTFKDLWNEIQVPSGPWIWGKNSSTFKDVWEPCYRHQSCLLVSHLEHCHRLCLDITCKHDTTDKTRSI